MFVRLSVVFVAVVVTCSSWANSLIVPPTIFTIHNNNDLVMARGQGNTQGLTRDQKRAEKLATGTCRVGDSPLALPCCSGFLVAGDLVMSNYHCLQCISSYYANVVATQEAIIMSLNMAPRATFFDRFDDFYPSFKKALKAKDEYRYNPLFETYEKWQSEVKEFGVLKTLTLYDRELNYTNFNALQGQTNAQGAKIKAVIAGDEKLDFVVFQLEKDMSQGRKVYTLSDLDAVEKQRLMIIGHPYHMPGMGEKVYDVSEECLMMENPDNPPYRMGHQCDTAGGSSGSAVLDYYTETVVALHNLGGAMPLVDAKKMARDYLQKQDPAAVVSDDDVLALAKLIMKMSTNGATKMSAILDYLQQNNLWLYDRVQKL